MNARILLFFTFLAISSADADTRTWTNSAGKTIVGELKEVAEGTAVLLVNGRKFEVPVSSLGEKDQEFIANWQAGAAEDKEEEAAAANSPILNALDGNLLKLDGRRLKKYELENPGRIEVVAFYSSASWCGPCHAFTPDLIKEYNSLKRKYDNFELVLLSSDDNESAWENYVEEYKMPWPTIKHRERQSSILRSGKNANFIPAIHIVKADGTVLDDASGGASSSLRNLEKILKEMADARTATASR